MIILCELGDDTSILFWWDPLLEGVSLKDIFNHLFELSGNKMTMVVEKEHLG
jgi:hypothetical protein